MGKGKDVILSFRTDEDFAGRLLRAQGDLDLSRSDIIRIGCLLVMDLAPDRERLRLLKDAVCKMSVLLDKL
jgi:hypothetical protein